MIQSISLVSLFGQCSLDDCVGGSVFNVNAPSFTNNTFTLDYLEIGNFYCATSPGINAGMFVQIFELHPDSSTVFNCGTFSDPPDNFLGSIPLGFGDGPGCGSNIVLFDSSNPFTLGPSEGLPSCDGAVFELHLILYLDPSGSISSSSTPMTALEGLAPEQKHSMIFGPFHNSITNSFPTNAYGGSIITNTIDNWDDVQNGDSSGGSWTLDCMEDIELFVQGTSFLTQCDPYDISSGLPSELMNSLSYSINGQNSIDIIANAGLPSSGGCLTGTDPILGFCYGGIYTEFTPTVLTSSELNPEPGDIVTIELSTTDFFTGETLLDVVTVTYDCYVMPITLLDFEAIPKELNNLIEWKTATELNNDFFTVERSTDGIHFEFVSQISAAGTSNSMRSYSILDQDISSDFYFYRLKQTDFDGSESYSEMITLMRVQEHKDNWTVLISPLNSYIEIHSVSDENSLIDLHLVNQVGQILSQQSISILKNGSSELTIPELDSGIYFLVLSTDRFSKVSKFLVN